MSAQVKSRTGKSRTGKPCAVLPQSHPCPVAPCDTPNLGRLHPPGMPSAVTVMRDAQPSTVPVSCTATKCRAACTASHKAAVNHRHANSQTAGTVCWADGCLPGRVTRRSCPAVQACAAGSCPGRASASAPCWASPPAARQLPHTYQRGAAVSVINSDQHLRVFINTIAEVAPGVRQLESACIEEH